MHKPPITIICDKPTYLEVQLWNGNEGKALIDSVFFMAISIFSFLFMIANIINLLPIPSVALGFIAMVSFYGSKWMYYNYKLPMVISFDAEKNLFRAPTSPSRKHRGAYPLSSLQTIELIQFTENGSLKELITIKPLRRIVVRSLRFYFEKEAMTYLQNIQYGTVEEWVTLVMKIDSFLKENNYKNVSIKY